MDWNIPATWPKQEYDMLLAADVLCDKQGIEPLVNVIQHYLCNDITDDTNKQAVIVDPVNQKNRQIFSFLFLSGKISNQHEVAFEWCKPQVK